MRLKNISMAPTLNMIVPSACWSLRPVGLLIVLLLFTSCGTIATLQADADSDCRLNLLYSGTRASATAAHGSLWLDIPFSVVADTLVLPYTIPRTVWNYYHRPTPEWNEEVCLRKYRGLEPS